MGSKWGGGGGGVQIISTTPAVRHKLHYVHDSYMGSSKFIITSTVQYLMNVKTDTISFRFTQWVNSPELGRVTRARETIHPHIFHKLGVLRCIVMVFSITFTVTVLVMEYFTWWSNFRMWTCDLVEITHVPITEVKYRGQWDTQSCCPANSVSQHVGTQHVRLTLYPDRSDDMSETHIPCFRMIVSTEWYPHDPDEGGCASQFVVSPQSSFRRAEVVE